MSSHNPRSNPRVLAVRILLSVSRQGRSLTAALQAADALQSQDRAFVHELCYGSLRYWWRLQALLKQCLHKPLKAKDADIQALALLGLYQLLYMRVPDHAAVSETVGAAGQINKAWAKKLLNAVMRKVQREGEQLQAQLAADPEFTYNHPQWLIGQIQAAWPQDWQAILAANDQHPPLTLRVNLRRISRQECVRQLSTEGLEPLVSTELDTAIGLPQATDIVSLPQFQAGQLSVQDGAAQLAAGLLAVQDGQRVLDVCAAPGGKTGHILERYPKLAELVAVELDPQRRQKIEENLQRLQLSARVIQGDATRPQEWWDGRQFERILLDVPCTASGVIRRHPDIKLLRKPQDIVELAQIQEKILQAVWPLLRPGGMLLYVTCSIFPEENALQIEHYLKGQQDCRPLPIDAHWGVPAGVGRQILPGENDMDGFYYARLEKTKNE